MLSGSFQDGSGGGSGLVSTWTGSRILTGQLARTVGVGGQDGRLQEGVFGMDEAQGKWDIIGK